MELYQKTAAELSAMLKNKEVSSVELTKAAFARTAAVEDKVGAYITLTEEHALETAVQDAGQFQAAVQRNRYGEADCFRCGHHRQG